MSDRAGDPASSDTRGGFARLATASFLYATGTAVGKLIGLLLLPVFTRSLTPEEFGRLDLLSTAQSAAASIILLGFDTAAARLYAGADNADRERLFPSWLALVLVQSLALTLVATVAAPRISYAAFGTERFTSAVYFTALAVVGSTVQLVALNALRNHGRALSFAFVSTTTLLINALLVIVFVPRAQTATSAVVSMAVSMGLGGVLGVTTARVAFRRPPSLMVLRRLMHLGLPAVPAVVALWASELANRSILMRAAGPAEVGYYSVATRFSSVAVLVVTGFQMAWQPTAFGLGTSTAALRRIADEGRLILASVTAASVLIAAVSPQLLRLASGDEYEPALRAVGFSLVFAVAYSVYHIATIPSAIGNAFRDIGATSALAALIAVIVNAFVAPAFGAWGTAAAIAAGQLTGALAAIRLARGRVRVPFDWTGASTVTLAAGTSIIVMTWQDGGASVVVRVVAVAAFTGVLVIEGSAHDLLATARERLSARRLGDR